MKRLLLLPLLLLFLAGCTTFKDMQSTAAHRYDARRKLSSALKDLEQGRAAAASFTLEEIVAEPGIKGVTDEALFRLSLLKLHVEEKDGVSPAIRYLERLRHEYADSVWMLQSRPLLDFLNAAVDVKKQNRNLKSLNSSLTKDNNSLTKDNKELHQNIERLKKLDLQLERKTR